MVDDLRRLSELRTDALLRELVDRYDVEPRYYSPDRYAARAREVVGRLMGSVRSIICPHRAALGAGEWEVVALLVSMLDGHLPAHLVGPFAVYAARVGVARLCAEHPA